jgi:hypothetical protein
MLVFEAFTALAVNCRVAPICREVLMPGLRIIFAGKGETPGGLWPPQAGKNKNNEIVTMTDDH